jgi:hypothetical protein
LTLKQLIHSIPKYLLLISVKITKKVLTSANVNTIRQLKTFLLPETAFIGCKTERVGKSVWGTYVKPACLSWLTKF